MSARHPSLRRRFAALSALCLFGATAALHAPEARAVALDATADAAVATGWCSLTEWGEVNMGSWDSMHINPCLEEQGSNAGLVRFDLAALGDASVDTAWLRLRHTDNTFAGDTYTLYRITGDWSEATVTGFTQPAFDPTPLASVTLDGSGRGFLDFDVTAVVQAWATGGADNFGFTLQRSVDSDDPFPDDFSDYIYVASREASRTEWRPVLYVNQPPVPEPATALLALLGLAVVGLRRRQTID